MHLVSATKLKPLVWAETADMGAIIPQAAGTKFWQPSERLSNIPPRIPGYQIRKDIRRWLTQALHFSVTGAPHRIAMLFTGPRGSGKTTQAEQFFAAFDIPVDRKNASETDTAADLFYSQSYNQEEGHHIVGGPLFNAFTRGYPFILNEAFVMRPSELLALNDVIERGLYMLPNGDEIEAAPGFMLIFTDNTKGNGDLDGAFAGVQTQNSAMLDRLIVLEVDYLPEDEEIEAALLPFINDPKAKVTAHPVAQKIVRLANMIRNSDVMGGSFSTRQVCAVTYETAAFASLAAINEDPFEFVLQARLISKLGNEEKLAIEKLRNGAAA